MKIYLKTIFAKRKVCANRLVNLNQSQIACHLLQPIVSNFCISLSEKTIILVTKTEIHCISSLENYSYYAFLSHLLCSSPCTLQ